MTPQQVLKLAKEKDVEFIDLRFMDFPGLWQHFSIPSEALDENTFEEGLGFDGSSIRGWQAINESDMIMLPHPDTAFIDPFSGQITKHRDGGRDLGFDRESVDLQDDRRTGAIGVSDCAVGGLIAVRRPRPAARRRSRAGACGCR